MSPASKDSPRFNVVEAHPPERGARPTQPVILYSCCCCCCCCLHTLGGVIGAAVAGGIADDKRDAPWRDDSTLPSSRLPSSQRLYWFSVLTAIVISWIVAALIGISASNGGNPLESFFVIAIGLILIGPAWLLGGAVVMAIRLQFNEKLRKDGRYWRSLWLITLGGVGGTVAGFLVMILIFTAMNGR